MENRETPKERVGARRSLKGEWALIMEQLDNDPG